MTVYRENADSLGAMVSEHPFARLWTVRLGIAAVAMTALGAGMTAWMTDGFSPHNRASFQSDTEQWTVSLVMGGLIGCIGLLCAVSLWVGRSSRVRLYEGGLVRESLGKSTTFRWADLASFWKDERITRDTEHFRYTVADKSGRRISIPWRLAHVRDVGQRIERELCARKLGPALAAHAGGETLSFGELQVAPRGLGRRGREIAWSEIAAVRVDNRFLAVWAPGASGPWLQLPTGEVANVEILVAILKTHVRVER
jgi:hypothetical protein